MSQKKYIVRRFVANYKEYMGKPLGRAYAFMGKNLYEWWEDAADADRVLLKEADHIVAILDKQEPGVAYEIVRATRYRSIDDE